MHEIFKEGLDIKVNFSWANIEGFWYTLCVFLHLYMLHFLPQGWTSWNEYWQQKGETWIRCHVHPVCPCRPPLGNHMLLRVLPSVYPKQPHAIHRHLGNLTAMMSQLDSPEQQHLLRLIRMVAEQQPLVCVCLCVCVHVPVCLSMSMRVMDCVQRTH